MKSKSKKMSGSLEGKTKERAMEPEKALEFKKGGKTKKAKHMGKVHGKKAGKRLDKFKRGGATKMTPGSPFSGAGNISERAGFASTGSVDKSND